MVGKHRAIASLWTRRRRATIAAVSVATVVTTGAGPLAGTALADRPEPSPSEITSPLPIVAALAVPTELAPIDPPTTPTMILHPATTGPLVTAHVPAAQPVALAMTTPPPPPPMPAPSTRGAHLVYLASQEAGKPYVYGASGPRSFDCSGLVQYLYAELGQHVPRTTQAQFNAAYKVPKAQKQIGDLIFFGTPSNIYHVGIYAGNGKMWSAPHTGEVVSLRNIFSDTYYVGSL